jgi:predicted transcriptional regulator
MPTEKSSSRSYRFTNKTAANIARLADLMEKSDTAIIEDAIAHLLGSLERDQSLWATRPGDIKKTHKRPPDAA